MKSTSQLKKPNKLEFWYEVNYNDDKVIVELLIKLPEHNFPKYKIIGW